jgi:hypothetical protein
MGLYVEIYTSRTNYVVGLVGQKLVEQHLLSVKLRVGLNTTSNNMTSNKTHLTEFCPKYLSEIKCWSN